MKASHLLTACINYAVPWWWSSSRCHITCMALVVAAGSICLSKPLTQRSAATEIIKPLAGSRERLRTFSEAPVVVIGHMLLLRACDGIVMLQQGDSHLKRSGAQLLIFCARLHSILACSR